MNARNKAAATWMVLIIAFRALAIRPQTVRAHCDTMDGPVVMDARRALKAKEVTPILKWIQKDREPEIREAFRKTLAVRTKGDDARELADMYFFETLVRIHRAGEGAPYTGLKPAGTDPGPAVTASDEALEHDSEDALVEMVTEAVEHGIRKRFARANEAQKHAEHDIQAGREFVKGYVEFVHYVERLYKNATAAHAHGDDHAPSAPEQAHEREQSESDPHQSSRAGTQDHSAHR